MGLDRSTLPALFSDALEARGEALERFAATPMPDGSEESWRYVDLDFDLADFPPAPAPGEPMAADSFLPFPPAARIVDGFVTEVSDGFEALPFDRLPVPGEADRFVHGQAAFTREGLRLGVPKGSVPAETFVVDVQGVTPGTSSYPHLSVDVGPEAEAELLVVYRSPPGTELVLVPRVELTLRDGARLRLLSVQYLDLAGRVVAYERVAVGRDASVLLGEAGLGGRLGRVDLDIGLDGDGSEARVVGLYFGHRHQALDYRLVITHRGRSSRSDVFLKGAVEDRARSVFSGLLKIERGARRASAFETNRNLVLSEDAKAHSVPNLEILCDEVMCGHGSSVGPLEEEHLYYLQSRGLRRRPAERLLVRGFFRQVLERLPVPEVTDAIGAVVDERFVRAQEEGRV